MRLLRGGKMNTMRGNVGWISMNRVARRAGRSWQPRWIVSHMTPAAQEKGRLQNYIFIAINVLWKSITSTLWAFSFNGDDDDDWKIELRNNWRQWMKRVKHFSAGVKTFSRWELPSCFESLGCCWIEESRRRWCGRWLADCRRFPRKTLCWNKKTVNILRQPGAK